MVEPPCAPLVVDPMGQADESYPVEPGVVWLRTVVETGMVSVLRIVESAGQLVTSVPQFVTV